MPTVPKPDPKTYYTCIEPHANTTGVHREGDRLRGDHPAVLAAPLWWVPETYDTDQRHETRQARVLAAHPEDAA
jgi:hypothetical protein